jgi:hypothetical protein
LRGLLESKHQTQTAMESRMRAHTCVNLHHLRGVCSGKERRDKHRNRAARGQRERESGRKLRGKRTLAAREVLDRVRLAHFFYIVLWKTPHAHPSPSSKYTYTQVWTLVTRRLSEREREKGTGRGREGRARRRGGERRERARARQRESARESERASERERERERGREGGREGEITSSTFCVCTIGSIVFFCSSNVIIPGDVDVLSYISVRASSNN